LDLIGKSLGNRYELLEVIGSGGMAIVYKARCRLLKRNVAVKILKTEFNQDKEFLDRFEIEAQASASLTHPNIVSVHDVGREKDMHYIVMEYVEGKTLKEYILREDYLHWKDSLNIAMQITSALIHAHKNNIVHRDIKPQNIIINDDGIAKVTDFGIAKAVSSATITKTGNTVGSVHYISPEQAQGVFVDSKTDLYSLGVVMYEMATGKLPFTGDNPVNIAMKHINDEPQNPYKLNNEMPQSLAMIILKLMSKLPVDRYIDAKELKKDLYKIYTDPEYKVDTTDRSHDSPTIMLQAIKKNNSDADKKEKNHRKNINKKGTKRKKMSKNNRKVVIKITAYFLIVAMLATGVGLGYNFIINLFNPPRPEYYKLEDFVGEKIEDAKAKLYKELGEDNVYITVIEEFHDTIEKGRIKGQNRSVGTEVKDFFEIEFNVSKGPEFIKIPDFKGKDYRLVEAELDKLGLSYTHEREISEEVEKDYVIKTDPEKEAIVEPGSSIIIYISKGEEPTYVKVPNLIGKTYVEAVQILVDLKFIVGEVNIEELEEGATITAQYPLPGEKEEEGEIVDIYFDSLETPEPTVSPSPTPTPVVINRKPVNDSYSLSGPDSYDNYLGGTEEVIKIVIQVKYSDTSTVQTVMNTKINKDTLPRTVSFSYNVPVDGNTKVLILVNNSKEKEYIREYDGG
jgi:serine/threonine protein kinase